MAHASLTALGANDMPFNRLRVTAGLAIAAVTAWALSSAQGRTSGGPVTVLETDPHHGGTVLAGTSAALLFRSRDWAESWTRIPFPAEFRSTLHAVLISPSQANVYFIGVSSEDPRYAGVFRSKDEGANWEQLPGLRHEQVWALACWPPDGRVIAAGTQDGVYVTRDAGETWVQISSLKSGPQPVVALAFDPAHPDILYAGTPHLSWKTTDGGTNWHTLLHGMEEDSDIFSIAVDWTHPRRLFAGACSGIYRSLDGGNRWVSLERAVGAQFRTYVVARRPRSANVFLAGTNAGLFQSVDGGTAWRRLSSLSTRAIAFDSFDPRRLLVATDQGILRSLDDGRRFVRANGDPLEAAPVAARHSDSRVAGISATVPTTR